MKLGLVLVVLSVRLFCSSHATSGPRRPPPEPYPTPDPVQVNTKKITETAKETATDANQDASRTSTTEFSEVVAGCNPKNCPRFYKHLQGRCDPIYDNSCCPIAFNCSKEQEPKDKSNCYYDGKKYAPNSAINPSNPCQICHCSTPDKNNETRISCNGVDCPSVFKAPSPDCITINRLGQCCGQEYCGDKAKELMAKPRCSYRGQTYVFGQNFFPEPCTLCTCNDDWNGDLANVKTCHPYKCEFDLDSAKLDKGCEPVYLENKCCPSYHICPEDVVSIDSPKKPANCFLKPDAGSGAKSVDAFFFNKATNLCEHFLYNGTGGNENRFPSFGTCMHHCVDGYNACDLAPVTGVCLAHFTKFFFNKKSGQCEPFLYGGCGGNANNFRTLEECNAHCKQTKEPMKCKFNKMEFNKGEQLIFKPKYSQPCVRVKCTAPPHLTFTHHSCPDPPQDEDCEEIYNPNECCPKYECKPKEKKFCLAKRFFQHEFAIGCTAEYNLDDVKELCPIRFNCPPLPGQQEGHCFVTGKSYKNGEQIANSPLCRQCYCKADNKNNNAVVNCLGKPCDNVGRLNSNNYQLCYYSFNDTDSCCPEARCEQRSELKTCRYNDNVFYDGQKIFPSEDPCTVCHCNKEWGGIEGPTCKKVECNLELQQDKIASQCIPVYLQSSCCPVNWICPETKKLPQLPDFRSKCYFNSTEYEQGMDLNYPHRSNCVKCKCVAPPRFTCIQEVCPPPPNPKKGYRCVPHLEPGECCAMFDCNVPIRNPCNEIQCENGEKCIRIVKDCPVKPCHDAPVCVSSDRKPCDDVNCTESELCIVHTFPCETEINCPIREACLPKDPCKQSGLQCGDGRVCKNVIPGCKLSPCPKVATCVDASPCHGFCKLDQRCITVRKPCNLTSCPMEPICMSRNCPTPACSQDSIFRPFGLGEGNCPWCETRKSPPVVA